MKLNAAINTPRPSLRVIAPSTGGQTKSATQKNGGPTITLKAVRKPESAAKTERKDKKTRAVAAPSFSAPAPVQTAMTNTDFALASAAYGQTRDIHAAFAPKAMDLVA